MSRIPPAVAQAVHERAGQRCEACGGYLFADASAFHHRLARKMGGTRRNLDTVENLMLVHGDLRGGINCHNITAYSIHQNPDRSKRLFHTLRDRDDPTASTPIVCPDLFRLRR